MYVPSEFACDEVTARAIARAHPFAVLVTPDLDSVSVPVVFEDEHTLIGHVARGSSFARAIEARSRALAIFSGPHAFVSPRTYVSPRQVPTWNYVAARVTGTLAPRASEAEAVAVLRALSRTFDPEWDAEPMLAARASGLVHGIVAFALRVELIVGKRKLGQNRADVDRIAAAHALAASARDDDRAIAAGMLAVTSRQPK
jgi:transcriptional regulator